MFDQFNTVYSLSDHEQCLENNPIVLYMKGEPEEPLCGFSNLLVNILKQCQVEFTSVNVMDPDIRQALKEITGWPTFPQLYVNKKFIGGSDIVSDLYATGKLQDILLSAVGE